jgi:acetolactate synthase small subunit
MVESTDRLILEVIRALEGDEETEIVKHLLNLRTALANPDARDMLTAEAEAARARVINIVNNFFYEKLVAYPTIKEYMDEVQTRSH